MQGQRADRAVVVEAVVVMRKEFLRRRSFRRPKLSLLEVAARAEQIPAHLARTEAILTLGQDLRYVHVVAGADLGRTRMQIQAVAVEAE